MNTVKNIIIVGIFASLTVACGASTQGSIQNMEHGFQTMTANSNFDTSVSAVEHQAEMEPANVENDVSIMRGSNGTARPMVRQPVVEKPCQNTQCGFIVPSIERPTITFGFEDTTPEPTSAIPTAHSTDFGHPQF